MKYKQLTKPEQWILKGIPWLFLIGTLLHFVYEFSGNNFLVGLIAPTNESVWEHMKMVLLPIIAWWSLYYLFKGSVYQIDKNRWFAGALTSLIVALLSIPLIFYFYTNAFGVELLWVDILILFLALLMGQLLGLHVYKNSEGISFPLALLLFLLITIAFMYFTNTPPNLPIFKEIQP